MLGQFLQTATLGTDYGSLASAFLALGIFIIIILLGLIAIFYVYMSLAYMAIGRKAGLKSPGLAWIPFIGPQIISFQASKMHWWPWLLYIMFFIPFVNIAVAIVLVVYSVIWHWKMFEAIGKPGWWAILLLLPVVGLVMIGIAAWGKSESATMQAPQGFTQIP